MKYYHLIIPELYIETEDSLKVQMEPKKKLFQNIMEISIILIQFLILYVEGSGFINGIVKLPNGKIERGKGIMQDLMDIEGVKPEKIDKEQYYLEVVGVK